MAIEHETNLQEEQIQRDRWFRWFIYLWAWSVIFHNGKTNEWIQYPIDVLTTAGAIGVLLSRARLQSFILLLMAQVAAFFVRLPNVTNHPTLAAIAALTMLVGFAGVAASGKNGWPAIDGWIRLVVPALRWQVLMLYFWVVFHKLNRDFFDPEWSAAVEHLENLSATLVKLGLPAIPMTSLTEHGAIWGTLIIEAAIPVFLLFAKTRILGIGVGLVFHFILGVEDFYDFTSLMYAGLFLFVPIVAVTTLDETLNRMRRWFQFMWRIAPPGIWFAGAMVAVASNLVAVGSRVEHSFRVFKIVWFLWSIGLFAVFAPLVWRQILSGARWDFGSTLRPSSRWFWIFPALVFINGACPYLGLKTRSVFAMFSNLRTEDGTTNHLIVPAWTQVFDFQRDMVRIVESSNPHLQGMAESGSAMPFFNLRTMVSRSAAAGHEGTVIRYQRGGALIMVDNAELDPELSQPYPYLMRKFLLFGSINSGPHQKNRH